MRETDACTSGLGAVLFAKVTGWTPTPTCICLQDTERNYAMTELETLGIVWAVKHFHSYLLGQEVVVYTDHVACASIRTCKNPTLPNGQ